MRWSAWAPRPTRRPSTASSPSTCRTTKLVIANGWIEGLTVGSIILGTVLGGVLISTRVSGTLLHFDLPFIDTAIDTPAEAAISVIVFVYAMAAMFNLYVPNTGVALKPLPANPLDTLRDFAQLLQAPVDRQARPDLARGDHAVLGRGRDAAVHRHRVGARRARLQPVQGLHAAGRGGDRHRARRGARLGARVARPRGERDPARHRHGPDRHRHDLRARRGSPSP